jgi:hypothetical protein
VEDPFAGYWKVPIRQAITLKMQLERDLGITGDDSVELLEAAELKFKMKFESDRSDMRESFNLQPNEYLFNAEGWGLCFRGRWWSFANSRLVNCMKPS